MLQRPLLAVSRMKTMQKRGMAAVKNWKRPSMDDYPVPKEPWDQAMAKVDATGYKFLAAGIISLSAVVSFGYANNCFFMYPFRYDLVDYVPEYE